MSSNISRWEIFSEKLPFQDIKIPAALIRKLVVDKIRPPLPIPDTPKLLSNVIEACWRDNPNDRPEVGDVLLLLRELKKWCQGTGSLKPEI